MKSFRNCEFFHTIISTLQLDVKNTIDKSIFCLVGLFFRVRILSKLFISNKNCKQYTV